MKQHKFVIADYKRCIGCATCMASCFKSAYERGKLSKSRLTVLRQAYGVMPTQCRQCDDGPCANVCPTGALRFNESCIELHEEICIGCKLCTIACPYGAISSNAELMPSINYATEPKYYLEIESQSGAKNIAIKCDMCNGRKNGPACVEVCPTSAIIMVDPVSHNHKLGRKIDSKAAESFVDKILAGKNVICAPSTKESQLEGIVINELSATPNEMAKSSQNLGGAL
ncbi:MULTISPECIES: 4Fe-4S dicluster domain-containing protein [unclassified Campylobacter]|uniref:4Fe-4S dicluster domain-containing protein n=1 Tax=unclassified Campylobacter TaxID=2593542 RepID=UPI003D340E3F